MSRMPSLPAAAHLGHVFQRFPRGALALGQYSDVQTLFIEPGSAWEDGYNESFNGKLRDELLNGEIFYTLNEAGPDRAMAHPLQHRQATQLTGLPAAGTAGDQPACHAGIRYATMSTGPHFTNEVVIGGWSFPLSGHQGFRNEINTDEQMGGTVA